MNTFSGVCIRIRRLRNRSFGSTSISRLWIRISQLSHVWVPSPHGLFRVGTHSRLVGSGIGPRSFTPVLSAIFMISPHMVFNPCGSVLDNLIRALLTTVVVFLPVNAKYPHALWASKKGSLLRKTEKLEERRRFSLSFLELLLSRLLLRLRQRRLCCPCL